jgi:hypothetical protein
VKEQEAALTLLALAEVPQVMSAFLPSPTTAYQGGAHPKRVEWLRRGEIVGSAVALAIAVAIWRLTGSAFPMIGAVIVLAIFLYEYERAIRQGMAEASTAKDTEDSGFGSGF